VPWSKGTAEKKGKRIEKKLRKCSPLSLAIGGRLVAEFSYYGLTVDVVDIDSSDDGG
jgi:hypothetical protein